MDDESKISLQFSKIELDQIIDGGCNSAVSEAGATSSLNVTELDEKSSNKLNQQNKEVQEAGDVCNTCNQKIKNRKATSSKPTRKNIDNKDARSVANCKKEMKRLIRNTKSDIKALSEKNAVRKHLDKNRLAIYHNELNTISQENNICEKKMLKLKLNFFEKEIKIELKNLKKDLQLNRMREILYKIRYE